MLEAWFDGACEPVNPGGIGTYGFVVRDAGELVVSESGLVPEEPGLDMTSNVAEYEGLRRLLAWLREHAFGRKARIHGDSRLVVAQVTGAWRANAPHLVVRRDACRELLAGLEAEIVHIPREHNGEADWLTHQAYMQAMEVDAGLRERYASALADPALVEACRRANVETYHHMGRREAERLLQRAQGRSGGEPVRPV